MQAVSSLLFMAHLGATCQVECLIFTEGVVSKFFFFKAFLPIALLISHQVPRDVWEIEPRQTNQTRTNTRLTF